MAGCCHAALPGGASAAGFRIASGFCIRGAIKAWILDAASFEPEGFLADSEKRLRMSALRPNDFASIHAHDCFDYAALRFEPFREDGDHFIELRMMRDPGIGIDFAFFDEGNDACEIGR